MFRLGEESTVAILKMRVTGPSLTFFETTSAMEVHELYVIEQVVPEPSTVLLALPALGLLLWRRPAAARASGAARSLEDL